MYTENRLRFVLTLALLVAGIFRYPSGNLHTPFVRWMVLGWVAFGILNVILAARGTFWLRMAAVGTSFWALLTLHGDRTLVILVWLIWPPAFMVANLLARKSETVPGKSRPEPTATIRARITLAAIILAVTIAALLYRTLVAHNVQQTAALFVGVPAILALFVAFAISPDSAVGVACKAVTIGLLVSLLFLGEGILCIAMSAPLFYAIAILIALVMKVAARRRQPPMLCTCALLLAILPMSMEGVTDVATFSREESIVVTKIVQSPAQDVERALIATPRFERARPLYLRAGFPNPISTVTEKTSGNDRWVIRFRGGETRLNGTEPRIGDLVLELEEKRPGLLRWRAVSDSSHMTHFLDWRGASVQWEAIDTRTTKVTWRLEYRRGLDPAWYFGPMERYAVRLAAGYLIDSVATP